MVSALLTKWLMEDGAVSLRKGINECKHTVPALGLLSTGTSWGTFQQDGWNLGDSYICEFCLCILLFAVKCVLWRSLAWATILCTFLYHAYISISQLSLFQSLISCSVWLYNDAISVFLCCIDHAPSNGQRNSLSFWFLSASSNAFCDVMLSASFVLSCICSKRSALLMLLYLCLIKGFVAAAFHGSLQNHLENIPPLKVIFLRGPCRLRFAGCWMLLNWKRPYLKVNGCRQSFKNIKSYSTNSSQNVMGAWRTSCKPAVLV